MRTELLTFASPDGPLDGALHRGDGRVARTAVDYLHGKTMNFYAGAARFLAEPAVRAGYDYLAANRRGHDVATVRYSFEDREGDAWATLAEHQRGVLTVLDWLRARYDGIVLAGHSMGGWLASWAAATHPDQVRALVLLSPILRPLPVVARAPETLERTVAAARALQADGRAREPIPLPTWSWLVSAEAVLQYEAGPEPPSLVDLVSDLRLPVLVVSGDADSANATRGVAALRAARPSGLDVVQVPDCNHFYRGREAAVAAAVAEFLAGLA